MGRREDSIAARRAALESQGRWRAQRKEKDDRCSDLGVAVVLALRERDSCVPECAGDHRRHFTDDNAVAPHHG